MSRGGGGDPLGEQLLGLARSAALAAHCPYSRFRVGAVVVGEDGRRFEGCNVENASYGLSMCAERVAVFKAVSAGCRSLSAVAVSCIDAASGSPPAARMPCGACRQVLSEFASSDAVVWIDGAGVSTLGELLPEAFSLGG